MARLLLKSDGSCGRVIELKLGVNRLGRSPDADIQIDHATVSALHCELSVEGGELVVRDCDSTNGTFLRGERVKEIRLASGQSFSVGEVELLVESTEIDIEIPKFDIPLPAPPVVRTDG